MSDMKLGLIGDNISRSKVPLLHRLAGKLTGLEVRYERLVPKDLGQDFDAVFDDCVREGYRGINVTYPHKERVVPKVRIENPLVRGLGTVNTVVFASDGSRGYNTDNSGFIAAYRGVRGRAAPGRVCMVGAGGVGKAVAFGLVALGLKELGLVDRDVPKAEALAEALRAEERSLDISVTADPAEAAEGACGLINCTPVGMIGHDGTPLPRTLTAGASWALRNSHLHCATGEQGTLGGLVEGVWTLANSIEHAPSRFQHRRGRLDRSGRHLRRSPRGPADDHPQEQGRWISHGDLRRSRRRCMVDLRRCRSTIHTDSVGLP